MNAGPTWRTRRIVMLCAGLLALAQAAGSATPHSAPHLYVADPTRSTLNFRFRQAGALNTGQFRDFTVELHYAAQNPAAGSLAVDVQLESVDTADEERDRLLRGPDWFDTTRFPTARFRAGRLQRIGENRFRASGALTIRDRTRTVGLPFTLQLGPTGGRLRGSVTLQRLDFGLGRGEWRSTEWVANDVTVEYDVYLLARGS
ncbi:MAG: YceI family protein [Steroidobacteraceae bacterium]|nr:YceI family protein [Steroidobacteraceae bacterium]MDW8260875.1 YceI family protein [Gammaproteobacteria bacterium]